MGATRGHHYLPQFLLKGFASRTKQDKAWVWYFRRNAAAKEVSVRHIGKETDFHGNPRDSDLEDKMQVLESAFGPNLARWRKGRFLVGVDEQQASQFVSHLIIRTKNLRDAFAGSAQVLVDEFTQRLDKGTFNPLHDPDFEDRVIRNMTRENRTLAKFARKNPWQLRAHVRALIGRLKGGNEILEWNQQVAEVMRAVDVSG